MTTHPGAMMAEAEPASSEQQLVERAVGGDVAAFNDLVSQLEGPLYKFVYRYTGDAESARDVCQEAFIRAYTNLDRFRGQAKFSSWLYQIALNVCRSEFRKQKARPAESLEDEEQRAHLRLVHAGGPAPDESAMRREHARALQGALAKLPEEQRTVIILKEYHGMKFREIAEILGTPESTVKSRLYHGFETLGRSLGYLKSEVIQP